MSNRICTMKFKVNKCPAVLQAIYGEREHEYRATCIFYKCMGLKDMQVSAVLSKDKHGYFVRLENFSYSMTVRIPSETAGELQPSSVTITPKNGPFPFDINKITEYMTTAQRMMVEQIRSDFVEFVDT